VNIHDHCSGVHGNGGSLIPLNDLDGLGHCFRTIRGSSFLNDQKVLGHCLRLIEAFFFFK
jgi:hypothetical protein